MALADGDAVLTVLGVVRHGTDSGLGAALRVEGGGGRRRNGRGEQTVLLGGGGGRVQSRGLGCLTAAVGSRVWAEVGASCRASGAGANAIAATAIGVDHGRAGHSCREM